MKTFEVAADHAHAHEEPELVPAPGLRLPRKIARKASGGAIARPNVPLEDPRGAFGRAINAGIADPVHAAVSTAAEESGHALPSALQHKFASSLGADLSGVRVHTGEASAAAASSLSARAYALGQDIHFAAGQYDPGSAAGEHLLAHEVAHTVQQRGASAGPQFQLEVSAEHDPSEHEADAAADAMVRGQAFAVTAASGVARKVYRQSRGREPARAPAASREDELEMAQLTHQMITMQQTAETRLDANINSWDAWVLQQIPSAVSRRFQRVEELSTFIDVAQSVAGTIIDVAANMNAELKAAAIAVKAIVAAGRFVARDSVAQDLATGRSALTAAAQRAFRADRDAARLQGRAMIIEFLQSHALIGGATEDNNNAQIELYQLVNQRYPQITESCLPQISGLLDQIFQRIAERAEEARQQRARADQVRRVADALGVRNGMLHDRDGGMPTEADTHRANAQVRGQTGYTGPDIPLAEVYGGPRGAP